MYQDEELLYEVRGPKNITELTAAELEKKLELIDYRYDAGKNQFV